MAARPGHPAKRTKKLSAPANEEELAAYAKACRIADIEPADTLRKLASALVAHVAKHKSVVFPIQLSREPRSNEDEGEDDI